MSNEDGAIWITYNGEIYNHTELRRALQERGHSLPQRERYRNDSSPLRRARASRR